MPYVVLLMEALTAVVFLIMIVAMADLHRWSLRAAKGRLDEVGRAIQTSAKWAFQVGMAILCVLTVVEIVELAF